MEGFPNLQPLVDWLVLLAPVLAAVFARGTLTRTAFKSRFIPGVIVWEIAYVVADWGYQLAHNLFVVLNVFIWRWTAMRVNDVGWSKWWVALWLAPLAGLILAITLCIERPVEHNTPEVFD